MTAVLSRGTPAEFVDTAGNDAGAVRTFSLAGYTDSPPTKGDLVMFAWNSYATGDWAGVANSAAPGCVVVGGPYGAAGNIGEDVFLVRERCLTAAEIAAGQVTQWLQNNFHPQTVYMLLFGNADLVNAIDTIGNTTNAASPGGASPETFTFKNITPTIDGCYVVAIQGIGAGQTPTSWGSTPGGWTLIKASTSKDGCYFIGQSQTAKTAIGSLTIQCTGPSLQGTNATSWSLKQNTSPYGDIEFVAAGSLAASATNGGSLTPGAPTGQQIGDFLVVVLWGRPTGTTEPATPAGWEKDTTQLQEIGTNDLRITTYFKRQAASTTDVPTFTVPDAAWGGSTTAGMYCFQAAFRGVDPANPFDITSVASSGAAAATFVPTGGTTTHDKVFALSCVATGDDNTLTIPAGTTSAQGFVAGASGASYQSTTGSDAAGGLAYRCLRASGTVVTMPTWTETANGNDAWAAISMFLRPAPRLVNRGVLHSAAIGRAATI